TVSLDIKNIGSVAGKEVVQLYLSSPSKSIDKPVKELKDFAKTKLLEPGESQTISFTLDARDLTSFNSQKSGWEAESGRYTLSIGASSANIKQSARFKLADNLLVEKVNKVLLPEVSIKELKH